MNIANHTAFANVLGHTSSMVVSGSDGPGTTTNPTLSGWFDPSTYNSGTTWTNLRGSSNGNFNLHNGVASGHYSSTSSSPAYFRCDGTDDYIGSSVPYGGGSTGITVDPADNWCLAMWVWVPGSGSVAPLACIGDFYMDDQYDSDPVKSINWWVAGDGTIKWKQPDRGNTISGPSISNTKWYFLALNHDVNDRPSYGGDTTSECIKMFVNGSYVNGDYTYEQIDNSYLGDSDNTKRPIDIGINRDYNYSSGGAGTISAYAKQYTRIGEVFFWTTPRSDTCIKNSHILQTYYASYQRDSARKYGPTFEALHDDDDT